ncbi:MAG: hypothetical protein WAK55_33060, partial [Xanthobacteraceae bacterium]
AWQWRQRLSFVAARLKIQLPRRTKQCAGEVRRRRFADASSRTISKRFDSPMANVSWNAA